MNADKRKVWKVYDRSWYYTSILPMVVCMIPVVVYGVLAYFGMKKEGLLYKGGADL